MKLLIGLGNPGKKYQNNRHNVGHMFVDYLKSLSEQPENLRIAKTDAFMNQSGEAVKKLMSDLRAKTSDLIIVHDDLDIPLGKFKIQQGHGPQLHNGLISIEEIIGKAFWRIRIGIDNRKPDKWIDGETYTLQDFAPLEKETIQNLFPIVLQKLLTIIKP